MATGLNEQQQQAVLAPCHGQLQIIAGPGTGKTKVLVARVAHLLLHHQIPPQNMIVTTFTKKAATEMTERLEQLLHGTGIEIDKLLIGTFHSICYRIIKIYGNKLGLNDYTIADERDSLHIMRDVLDALTGEETAYLAGLGDECSGFKGDSEAKHNGYDPKKLRKQVSRLKAGGVSALDYSHAVSCNKALSFIYTKYQAKLSVEKLLDFDDCLLHCHQLVSKHPVLNFVRHTLVDEFQDTNEIQLRLMYQFARGHPTDTSLQNNVTIVGDPDQSIYAFRDAQSVNFAKMKQRYPKCAVITLSQNYRSTSDILDFSESIMRQQNDRTVKSLQSQHSSSYRPVYANLGSPEDEARWIAYQIEHLLSLPETPVKYSDVAILVRTAYQTRVLENEFVRKRIPYVMVKGKAFWERKEVLAIMDYLRVVAHDNDRLAVLRTLNLPKRGIGEKTLATIDHRLELAQMANQLVMQALARLVEDCGTKLTSKNKQAISQYVQFVNEAKSMLETGSKDQKLGWLAEIFAFVYSSSGLQKEYLTDETAELNISEVKGQFCEFCPRDENLPLFIGGTNDDVSQDGRNFVAKFIHSVGLYETDSTTVNHEADRGKVSVSTIHGSKGLEWPVVFVPGLSENLLPAKFAMDSGGEDAVNEERRCFYVATTRAKTLLYLSSYTEKNPSGNWGRRPIVAVSRFLKLASNTGMLNSSQQAFATWDDLTKLYLLLGRQSPATNNFDLQHFVQLYHARQQSYVRGQDHEVGSYFQARDKPTNTNGLGFTSAKVEMERKKVIPAKRGFKAPRLAPREGGVAFQARAPEGIKAPRTHQIRAPINRPTDGKPLVGDKGIENSPTAGSRAPLGNKAPIGASRFLSRPLGNRAPIAAQVSMSTPSNTNRAPPYIPNRRPLKKS
ncbi:P-loop containing nucleoside triphosphate hydrolase protein [Suhomyces tanzawaensis NRRL Y-17324]|uniref:DNA 3'-5' helicase n=1 Tax=Suhomyces tanzawaensis NRRL Y-17324 TaxID=984487 RepID=A0A1E4SC60_9ASCO|nr:P-loop containing nucleoside triphosphate hydrolase protein [Suhomyces tanzawaensis NRRL Y-17324]ODV77079.1 P-loop containing nucleoside triphosphate hydrolase protein [Suhomyces tanzawaensis NRRL Y-17324]